MNNDQDISVGETRAGAVNSDVQILAVANALNVWSPSFTGTPAEGSLGISETGGEQSL